MKVIEGSNEIGSTGEGSAMRGSGGVNDEGHKGSRVTVDT